MVSESVHGNVVIWVLKEGGGCGLARFLVALSGGGFAVARMSADDRGSMGIGVGGDGGGLGAVKFFVLCKRKQCGNYALHGFKLRYTGLSIDRFSLHRQVGHRPRMLVNDVHMYVSSLTLI